MNLADWPTIVQILQTFFFFFFFSPPPPSSSWLALLTWMDNTLSGRAMMYNCLNTSRPDFVHVLAYNELHQTTTNIMYVRCQGSCAPHGTALLLLLAGHTFKLLSLYCDGKLLKAYCSMSETTHAASFQACGKLLTVYLKHSCCFSYIFAVLLLLRTKLCYADGGAASQEAGRLYPSRWSNPENTLFSGGCQYEYPSPVTPEHSHRWAEDLHPSLNRSVTHG